MTFKLRRTLILIVGLLALAGALTSSQSSPENAIRLATNTAAESDILDIDILSSMMGYDEWRLSGYDGSDVRIGILDSGFDNWTPEDAQANLGIPPERIEIFGSHINNDSPHGRQVLEIAHHVAPEASYRLCTYNNLYAFNACMDALVLTSDEPVHVIIHSGNINVLPRRGQNTWSDKATRAVTDSDVVWVNAVGNYAGGVAPIQTFQSSNGYAHDFRVDEFGIDREGNTFINMPLDPAQLNDSMRPYIFLSWDARPGTSLESETKLLYLSFRRADGTNTTAEVCNTGSQHVENGCYRPATRYGRSNEVRINFADIPEDVVALQIRADGPIPPIGVRFIFGGSFLRFVGSPDDEPIFGETPILPPADTLHVLSVGALLAENNIAEFSAFGFASENTGETERQDVKPDLVTYGALYRGDTQTEFNGTSAATPLIGGIVALMRDMVPEASSDDIRRVLVTLAEQNSIDDLRYGRGPLTQLPHAATMEALIRAEMGEPEPSPPPGERTEIPDPKLTVAVRQGYIRVGPSTQCERRTWGYRGDQFHILGWYDNENVASYETAPDIEDNTFDLWYRIALPNGRDGWIYSGIVDVPDDADLQTLDNTESPEDTCYLLLDLPTAQPTNTPVTPTNTPVTPTNTPVTPTNTPQPTSTPVTPTNTPQPTSTPVTPTNTPQPTNTLPGEQTREIPPPVIVTVEPGDR